MSEQLRESLSAALDDEADAFELRRVLDEAKHNDDLREQWHRFHLVRDLLRDDLKSYHPDLRDTIWEQLNQPGDDEQTIPSLALAEDVADGGRNRRPWLGRAMGTAVAAAVAMAVMFNGGFFDVPEAPAGYAGAEQRLPVTDLVPVMYQQATSVDQQRQNALMLHHIQQRAMNQAGLASFVKLATFSNAPASETGQGVQEEGPSAP